MTQQRGVGLSVRLAAEFAVIVIGVLVALWLEGWASDRESRVVEVQYLRSLAIDVRRDSMAIANIHIPTVVGARMFLELAIPVSQRKSPFPEDTLAFLRQMSVSHLFPIISEAGPTYEELVATGSLRLLESSEVRSAVVEYYRFKLLALRRLEITESGYPFLIRSYLPTGMGTRSQIFLGASREEEMLRLFDPERALTAIRTPEFLDAALRHLNYVGGMEPTLDDWLEQAQDLLVTLGEELNRLN